MTDRYLGDGKNFAKIDAAHSYRPGDVVFSSISNHTVAGENLAVWFAANGWGIPYRDCACVAVRDTAELPKAKRLGIWSWSFALPWEWRASH